MAIIVAGLSHRTVPLEILERLTFSAEDLPKALAQLTAYEPIREGVILSTCNRTEVYVTVHRFHPAVQSLRRFLSDVSGVDQDAIASGQYVYYDDAAVRHLFAVASGLDSMVIGESQILGQVRDAFRVAEQEGTARRFLSSLFQRALRVGKRARSETAISRHVVSLPQAAARMASELSGGLADRHVLVIGAGRMGGLAARAVSDLGCAALTVCSRTTGHAELLAARLNGSGVGLDALPTHLRRADVVVAATSSTDHLVTREVLEAVTRDRSRPLVAVDLGMPRDIDPAAADLSGLLLRDIDDLRSVAEEGANLRRAELPKVEGIVAQEVENFCAWERALALGPSIAHVHERAEAIRSSEMRRLARRGDRSPDELATLDAMTRTLVNKLLHRPVTQIKELVRGKDGQVYLEVFREIFDLDVED